MKWKTIQIPKILDEECEECHEKLGHPSKASLVREAIRHYLDQFDIKEG